MVILNPIKNKTKDATTYSSVQENIDNEYINIIIPTTGASSFKVNGSPPISSSPFKPLGTSKYSYMQLDVAPYNASVPKKSISIRLTADEGFNAIVYGFGNHESYAYSAGISQPDICSDPDLPAIVIPNTFTPNNDGLNDVWTITNINYYPQCIVHIFNRWGTLIYSSDDGYQHPWDGTFEGLNLPVATYYYIIDLNDCKALHAGYVAIIR
jgi:gliding motility-associated-like protein